MNTSRTVNFKRPVPRIANPLAAPMSQHELTDLLRGRTALPKRDKMWRIVAIENGTKMYLKSWREANGDLLHEFTEHEHEAAALPETARHQKLKQVQDEGALHPYYGYMMFATLESV